MGVITFEAISDILEAEKESGIPTILPDNFVSDVSEYIRKKEKLGRGDTESIISKVEKIFRIRLKKISDSVIRSMGDDEIEPPPNMISEEAEIFESLRESVLRFSGSVVPQKPDDVSEERYEFTEDAEEFMGTDLKAYGPFRKGDIACIPKENAEAFIRAGKVRVPDDGEDR